MLGAGRASGWVLARAEQLQVGVPGVGGANGWDVAFGERCYVSVLAVGSERMQT